MTSGITTYGLFRDRGGYDENWNGLSEKTKLQSNTPELNAFGRPNDNSNLHFDMTATKDFRRGGGRFSIPPQFADIAAQLNHIRSWAILPTIRTMNELSNKFSAYISAEHVDRKSFYGGLFWGVHDRILSLPTILSGPLVTLGSV